ncbi:MAG: hypothetical protein Q9223_000256 [Gallowayella weberi]
MVTEIMNGLQGEIRKTGEVDRAGSSEALGTRPGGEEAEAGAAHGKDEGNEEPTQAVERHSRVTHTIHYAEIACSASRRYCRSAILPALNIHPSPKIDPAALSRVVEARRHKLNVLAKRDIHIGQTIAGERRLKQTIQKRSKLLLGGICAIELPPPTRTPMPSSVNAGHLSLTGHSNHP